MFRRKRIRGSASEIPWWPAEAPAAPPNGGGAGFGPGGFGPDGFGPPGGRRGAIRPEAAELDDLGPPGGRAPGAAPPLATHDPFGGWPAFAEQRPATDPLLGQPHPSTGWPLVEPFADPIEPAVPPARAPVDSPDPTGSADAGPNGAPDWLPLLTHPIGGQRFRPDVEAPAARSAPAAPSVADHAAGPPASVTSWPDPIVAPNPAEASSLAGAFAADYLSWDQDNPTRRGQVLKQYLPSEVTGDPTLLGWSGKGRQRSEFALPGAVHPDGEGRLVVDVRVRVTPYRRVGESGKAPAPLPTGELEVAGVPAAAPAPTARGWKSLDSHWVRLTVPVTRERGRLVVDTWDEQLGQEPPVGPPRDPAPRDPSTAEDSDEDFGEDSGEDSAEDEGPDEPAEEIS